MSIACKVRPIGGEALLPDGYRRCEYLESTGTQIISTGIYLGAESEIRGVFQNTSTSGVAKIAGSWVEGGRFAIYQINNKSVAFYTGDNGTGTPITVNTLEKMQIIFNVHKASVNASEISLPKVGFTTESICTLFDRNYYRIYAFSISRNNLLQLNFIPCLDDKGKPCMFDTVSRTPYYNKGTGEFLYKLKTPLIRKLPRGFQPLDYLEATGAQYIDTGVKLSSESEVKCEFMEIDKTLSTSALYGNETNTEARFSAFLKVGSTSIKSRWDFASEMVVYNTPLTIKTKYNSVHNATGVRLNGLQIINFASADSFETAGVLTLFGFKNDYAALARIYSFSISRSGVPQLDFQPCLDPTGKPCMWDYVTRRPFYNQNTTGQFIAGMTLEQVRGLSLPAGGGQLTISVPADTPDSAVEQLQTNNPTWQIAIQYRTDNEN